MRLCPNCNLMFPDELFIPMITSAKEAGSFHSHDEAVCPICALLIIREVHNVPDFTFINTKSNMLLADAISWLELYYGQEKKEEVEKRLAKKEEKIVYI